jgi:hypothetical protein
LTVVGTAGPSGAAPAARGGSESAGETAHAAHHAHSHWCGAIDAGRGVGDFAVGRWFGGIGNCGGCCCPAASSAPCAAGRVLGRPILVLFKFTHGLGVQVLDTQFDFLLVGFAAVDQKVRLFDTGAVVRFGRYAFGKLFGFGLHEIAVHQEEAL